MANGKNNEDGRATFPKGKRRVEEPQEEEKRYSWLQEFRYGRTISVEFFRHNAWLLLVLVVAVIALIGLRYQTKTKMAEIKRLNTELQRAESNKLQQKANYMSLIRETEMRRLVREKGLSLEFQEQPPYELILEGNE